jgi:hypothetical protein
MGVKTFRRASKANAMPDFQLAKNDEKGARPVNDLLAFFAGVFGAFTGVDEGQPKRHLRDCVPLTARHRAPRIAANAGRNDGFRVRRRRAMMGRL